METVSRIADKCLPIVCIHLDLAQISRDWVSYSGKVKQRRRNLECGWRLLSNRYFSIVSRTSPLHSTL